MRQRGVHGLARRGHVSGKKWKGDAGHSPVLHHACPLGTYLFTHTLRSGLGRVQDEDVMYELSCRGGGSAGREGTGTHAHLAPVHHTVLPR